MAGTRGSIKGWLKIDTTVAATAANPAVLSGVAGALSQAAMQQEAVQLRDLLKTFDQKLDQVLRGQRDDILGDLAGIESELRSAINMREIEGSVDSLGWSKLSGVSLQIRQVHSKALHKLGGIADDLDQHKRIGDLNAYLPLAESGVQLWVSALARCVAALDELAILEIDHYAAIAPDRVSERRRSLDISRQDDQAALREGISVLLQRMDAAAETANQNKILRIKGVPAAVKSISHVQGLIERLYGALEMEVDWNLLEPVEWRAAIRQRRQWTNGLKEAGSMAWEKGKPAFGALALSLLAAAIKDNRTFAKLTYLSASLCHEGYTATADESTVGNQHASVACPGSNEN